MDLSETDKELIAKIDELLNQLKNVSQSVFELREVASLHYPNDISKDDIAVDVVEPKSEEKPVFWVSFADVDGFNPNKIYTASPYKNLLMAYNDYGHTHCFKSEKAIFHTYEAYIANCEYLAQQKEVEKEWKVGEWIAIGGVKRELYLITSIDEYGEFELDNQDGKTEGIYKQYLFRAKPTSEEIFNHLKGIAERKYPVGTKVKVGGGIRVSEAQFRFFEDVLYLYVSNEIEGYPIWSDGVWAEAISEPKPEEMTKRRNWSVNVERVAEHLNEYKIEVAVYDLDDRLTEEQAQFAATKIREILK